MRSALVVCAGGLLAVLSAQPAEAVRTKQKQSVLLVDHQKGEIQIEDPAGTSIRTVKLDSKMKFEVEPGETLIVRVVDQNPILFGYGWKESPKTETEDHKAAVKFAAVVKSMAAGLGTLAGLTVTGSGATAETIRGGQIQRAPLETALRKVLTGEEEHIIDSFVGHLFTLADRAAAIPGLIEKSATGFDAAEEVKTTVLSWDVDRLTREVEDELGKLRSIQLRLLEATGPNIQNEALDSSSTSGAKPEAPAREGGSTEPNETVSSSSPGTGVQAPGTTGTLQHDALFARLLLAKDQELDVRTLINTLRSFTALAVQIHQPLTFEPPIVFDPVNNGGGVLTITPVEANAREAGKAKSKTGSFEFATAPYSPVHYSFGAAAVYSFIEAKDYGTETVDGTTRIVRKDSGDEVNGLDGAMLFSITPDAWSGDIFGGSFQLGLIPTNDKLGFFLGGAIRIYNNISLGAGVTYQQTERLARGLKEGDVIASPDQMKTNAEFESGLYVTMTVDLIKIN